ncbi:MAG TPA: sulfurtransferase complex subunit TusD [Nitrospinota bacterium]|jgi:tRNA 2-thiouridine synthesizing protein D|nr:sulfurtransferase complex subunit TusD [Nitrospinota bacterium]|tara:strand:- start:7329 stop:7685 length:357 start_codon:yes stop_codon:yes gene_type:complete
MKFAIQVLEGPYTHQASDSAYSFVKAALDKGHEIVRIFFYHDGVINVTDKADPPQDDRNIYNQWAELGKEKKIDIVACIAASKRRGIVDSNIVEGTRISGLGQLTDMAIEADRLVTFG